MRDEKGRKSCRCRETATSERSPANAPSDPVGYVSCWRTGNKKALQTDSFEGLHPAYLTLFYDRAMLVRATAQCLFKAGLLTPPPNQQPSRIAMTKQWHAGLIRFLFSPE